MNLLNNKKGQAQELVTDLKPSMIIVLIILLFLAYLIMIPPESRDKIIGNNTITNTDNSENTHSSSNILLSKSPGEITKLDYNSVEHPMPMLYLYANPQPKEIFFLNSFYTERSFFSEDLNEVRFVLENPDDIEKAYLSFKTEESKGVTTIILNGYTLYSDKIPLGNINPIEIPKGYLRKENVLVFKLRKPFIFSKNKLKIEDLKIIAQVLEKENLQAKTSFTLFGKEFSNLDSAKLYFTTSCDINDIGKLTIRLNNQIIHESTPACNNLNVIEISHARILEGENTLEFSLDKGKIRIDQLKLLTKLKQPSYPLYYFQVSQEQIDSLKTKNAYIKFEFPDDLNRKRFVFNINGIKTDIETTNMQYTYKINSFLREGNNYLQLEPISDDLNIVHLEIYIK
ncbi:MAG: hypothetical protein PWP03_535 [Candidatus Woesearchaeota archaeon]|nr:hypothetical protein [Candidatus Woesearchaeota archaeon]